MRHLIIFIAFFPCISQAEIFKCIKDNKTVFQDAPCSLGKAKVSNSETEKQKSESNKAPPPWPTPAANLRTKMCYTASSFQFQERPCETYEKSSPASIEDATEKGFAFTKTTNNSGPIAAPPAPSKGTAVEVPVEIKRVVSTFSKLSGEFRITKIGETDGRFKKYVGTACLSGFYFFDENIMSGKQKITDSGKCKTGDWKWSESSVSYLASCVQNGKKASSRLTISRENGGGKLEVKAEEKAPSDFLPSDFSFQLERIGDCQ